MMPVMNNAAHTPEHLPGGSGGVTRVGDTVRRPTGPWTPAVHELLNLVETVGLEGVPHVLGEDESGQEILSYIDGRTIAVDEEVAPDTVLGEATAWLRRFHDVGARHRPEGPRVWRSTGPDAVTPAEDQVVCHNDPGAYNWILRDGHFVGMIDWDQAGPGQPIDDLAFLCWSGIPLFREIPEADAIRRLHLVVENYPRWSAPELLDAIVRRMRTATDRIARGIDRGDAGMLSLAAHGEPGRTMDRLADFESRVPELLAAFDTGDEDGVMRPDR